MKTFEALRILIISIFWIFNKYATGTSSTTEDTSSGSKAFSCAGKVIGGYYADVQENCQMFHVCTIGENGEIRDIVFRCLNGTVFDQETRVCEREEEVNCPIAQSFFHLNNDLYGPGIIPETAMDPVEARTPTTQQQVLDPSDALMGVMATPGSPLSPDEPSSHRAEAPDKPPNTESTISSTPTSNNERFNALKTNRTISTTADTKIPTTTTTTATSTTTTTTDTTTPFFSPFGKLSISPSQSDRKSVSLPLDILKTNPSKKFARPTDINNSEHDIITNNNNNNNSDNNNNNKTTPLIITRTASSTSVSASARVHIQTPLSRFSLRQGTDPSHTPLPAPHLRPSLLKLAAQSMNKAKERNRNRRIKRDTNENDFNNSMVTTTTTITKTKTTTTTSNEHNTNRLSSPRHSFLPISVLYNLLSFILKPQVLQPSTFTLNNQQVYGSDIFEPRFRNALKHALGQTHRQITVLKSDKETTTRDANSLCSGITNAASLIVDVDGGCQFLHLCLPQQNQRYAFQTFVCEDKHHVFDPTTMLCIKKQNVQCNNIQSSPSFKEAIFFSTYLVNLCPLFPHGSLMIDSLSGCEQYFQCPSSQDSNEPIVMKRCPSGYLFSQVHQRCVPASSLICSRDLYSLLKLFELKSSGLLKDYNYKGINMKSLGKVKKTQNNINSIPDIHLSRKKRAFTFEDQNLHRELASGSLTNAAGVFSDHVSVIETQGAGNVLEGKINNPKFPLRDDQTGNEPTNSLDLRYKKKKSVAPETSLELNKTVLNGTTIEVSKIASPDNKGEVTITSIVPKLNRHNGNGHKTERSDDEVSSPNPTTFSNGKTKITLLGSSHGKSEENKDDETIIEHLDTINSTMESEVTDKIERDTSMQTEVPENSEIESATDMITDAAPAETTTEDVVTTEKPQEQTTTLTTSTTTTTTTPPPTTTTTTTTTTSTTTTSTTTTTPSTTSIKPESSTQEEKVETNFSCKSKELEQFYPDIEKDCKLFHYCSPGFSENEILDLTFVCSNDTRFDVRTNKCQDMHTVVCGEPVPTTTTPTTTSTTSTTSEATSPSTEAAVSSSTTTATTSSSTTTVESTTKSPELLVSSSANVQTASEAVEDSTSNSEASELSGVSTVSEDPKSDSTESIITDEEGSTIPGDLKSENLQESESKITDPGAEKRSPSDETSNDTLSSDSSTITETATEGSEKDKAVSLTEPSKVSDHPETTTVDNSASIIDSSGDSNNKESSTITPNEKVSQNVLPSDVDTVSSLGSTTDSTPEGTEISNLDSGTSTK